ncbi:hypothetical protein BDP55DRAFT_691026 [Colletotrichum godetiae]|uniref:NAD(P)-binding protein n=1 Tax=Colletotrichum godetiae TaxID=1209918 RepID=A0AAJ0F2C6_9PEZI|nr:uncharacterized protein BDP55DRAFT_691026 [Colletotrichum godetiae]KAK1690358.1 hypothetical protein BDP55DRAFT_691026 [Colletotrichum godetiae]
MATPAPTPRTCFITGCTSGFGGALVRKLMAEGLDNVIATGRGGAEARLAHLRETTTMGTGASRLRNMELDVGAASEAEIRVEVAEAWGCFEGGVDVVVNNAGFIVSGLMEELTRNFHGPLNVTRAFLPFTKAKGTGTLVASKFALEGAVETLSKELSILAPTLRVLIAVARIVELVRGDGMVGGKGQVPLRVVLGSDGWERIRDKCLGVLEGLKGWEDVARSTGL